MAIRKIYKTIIISVLVLSVFFVFGRDFRKENPPIEIADTIKASIIAGEEKLQIASASEQSLYEVLVQAKEEGLIKLEGKNYPMLGFFVTKIGSLESSPGKYLFYYINGKEASVGVSSYSVQDGDIIEWKVK